MCKALSIIFLLVAFWGFSLKAMMDPEDVEAHFINVGQGHSTVVVTEDQSFIVDCGSTASPCEPGGRIADMSDAERSSQKTNTLNRIVELLVRNQPGSGRLRPFVAMASHKDDDHTSHFPEVLEKASEHSKIRSRQVVYSFVLGGTQKDFSRLVESLEPSPKNVFYSADFFPNLTTKKLTAVLGDECTLLAALKTSDSNTNSLVVEFRFGNHCIILPGDATDKTTKDILDNGRFRAATGSRILQTSHHGAEKHGCNDRLWLGAVDPNYVIASSGRASCAHPRNAVVDRILALPNLRQVSWHGIQCYGNIPLGNTTHTKWVTREQAQGEKPRGYEHGITRRGFYVTSSLRPSQDIRFSFKTTDATIGEPDIGPVWASPEDAAQGLLQPAFARRMEHLALSEPVFLPFFQRLSLAPFLSLTSLDLSNSALTTSPPTMQHLVTTLRSAPGTALVRLTLRGNGLDAPQHHDFKTSLESAWGSRGLQF